MQGGSLPWDGTHPALDTDVPSKGGGARPARRSVTTANAAPTPAEKHSPFSQAFLPGQAGPAHPADPVRDQRAKVSSVSTSRRTKPSLDPVLIPPAAQLPACDITRTGAGSAALSQGRMGSSPHSPTPDPTAAPPPALHQRGQLPPLCFPDQRQRQGSIFPERRRPRGTYLRPHVSWLTLQTSAPGRALGRHAWLGGAQHRYTGCRGGWGGLEGGRTRGCPLGRAPTEPARGLGHTPRDEQSLTGLHLVPGWRETLDWGTGDP